MQVILVHEMINGKTDAEGKRVEGIKVLMEQNRKDLEALELLLKKG